MPTTFWRMKSQPPNIIDNFLKTGLKSAYMPQTEVYQKVLAARSSQRIYENKALWLSQFEQCIDY